jgi:type IV pilus assembly protein PilC
MESGISLSECLGIVIGIEKIRKKREIFEKIKRRVDGGMGFSKSIVEFIPKFDPRLLSLISFGESSGILALSLRQGISVIEKGSQIKKKLVGALIYPAFIGLATIGMTLFLVLYIFPKIIPLFSSMNITLPLLTRCIRYLYFFLFSYGIGSTLFLVLFGGAFILLYKKSYIFRYKTELIFLRLPFLGPILQKYYITEVCRSVSTLLECGQLLPTVLEQVSGAATLEPYKKFWLFAREEIIRGSSVSSAITSQQYLFPGIVGNMLSIGERAGSLVSMFKYISNVFEEDLEQIIKQISTSIEPVLMIVMGIVVGSVALSIILPIYEITNHLSH